MQTIKNHGQDAAFPKPDSQAEGRAFGRQNVLETRKCSLGRTKTPGDVVRGLSFVAEYDTQVVHLEDYRKTPVPVPVPQSEESFTSLPFGSCPFSLGAPET